MAKVKGDRKFGMSLDEATSTFSTVGQYSVRIKEALAKLGNGVATHEDMRIECQISHGGLIGMCDHFKAHVVILKSAGGKRRRYWCGTAATAAELRKRFGE